MPEFEFTPTTVEQRIRQIMEKEQLSQQDFAQKLEISPASLSSIYNGRTRATNNHTMAIHRAFPKISINWLLFGEGAMYGNQSAAEGDEAVNPSADERSSIFNQPGQLPFEASDWQEKKKSSYSQPVRLAPEEEKVKIADIPKRQVKEIRVFYDDGTYETFTPQK